MVAAERYIRTLKNKTYKCVTSIIISVISDIKGEEIVVIFYEKGSEKTKQKEFRIKK